MSTTTTTPTDPFTHAVELAHTYIPSVTQLQRLEAEHYLMTLRTTPDGLNLALRIIGYEQPVHDLRCFWAFNTVMHHLSNLACTLDDAQTEELYRTLFLFIQRHFFSSSSPRSFPCSIPSSTASSPAATAATNGVQRHQMEFLTNKHAQVMVAGLQEFFPSRWQSFFDDVFELLTRSEREPHVRDAVMVYFLRLFECIDERIVSTQTRGDRDREQRARDMEIKDTMRMHVIPHAVATWYAALCHYRVHAPEVANICMSVVQTYIEWVDVALFFTSDWFNLLYFFLTIPSLRQGACECIRCLVEKKQLPAIKMESLRTLNIVDSLPRIIDLLQMPPETDDDIYFLEVVARLVGAVADEFLSVYEHINASSAATAIEESHNGSNGSRKNSIIYCNGGGGSSSSSRGGSRSNLNTNRHPGGNMELCGEQQQQQQHTPHLLMADEQLSVDNLCVVCGALNHVLGQLLRLLSVEDDHVSDTLLPFVQRYVKSTALREEQAVQLLLAVYSRTIIHGLAENEHLIWLDDIIDRRKQLYNLMRLILRRYPSVVLHHLHAMICRAVAGEGALSHSAAPNGHQGGDGENPHQKQPPPPPPVAEAAEAVKHVGDGTCGESYHSGTTQEEVEAALRYLYEVGESIRMEDMQNGMDGFAQLVRLVLSSEHIAHCPCSAVHLSYFEVLDRYYAFFVYHKEYIPLLLHRLLMMPHGVTNRHPRVRARVCYLFGHLVQLLRGSLTPHVQDIVNAVHSVFTTGVLLPSERRELYEATGNVLSVIRPPLSGSADSGAMIMQVIRGVTQNLCAAMPEAPNSCVVSTSYSGAENGDHVRAEAVADGISFLSALAKGLRGGGGGSNNSTGGSGSGSGGGGGGGGGGDYNNSAESAISSSAANSNGNSVRVGSGAPVNAIVVEVFHSIMRDVMHVVSVWHVSAVVRDRVGQYFMQMVQTLPFESMEVYITTYIGNSLVWMDSMHELTKLLRLLFHLIHRGGARVSSVLACTLPLVLQKAATIGTLSISPEEMGVVSESMREKRDVYRQLFAVLHSATHAGCVETILSVPPDTLAALLSQLLASIELAGESELTKLALQIMMGITCASAAPRQVGGSGMEGGSAAVVACGGSGSGADTHWVLFMLRDVVPTILKRLLSPTFNAMDAKSFLLVGDAGLLLKTLMHRLGPCDAPSLCTVLYNTLQPLVGEGEVAGLVAALQDGSTRFSTEMKMRFRNLLLAARERRRAAAGTTAYGVPGE